MPSSGRFGVFLRGISPPAGGEFLCPRRQRNQNAAGDGSDEHFVLIVAHPTPSGPSGHLPLTGGVGPGPHYGGRVPVRLSKISGARKSEWVSEFQPGHWALGLQKLPLVRFHTCAWVSRTNAPGRYAVGPVWDRPLREKGAASISAVGAAVSRLQAFPLGGRCPSAHTGADEGAMIERFFV